MKDALLLFAKMCAVTMYELTIHLSKDGRARGLWVSLKDCSRGRSESKLDDFEHGLKRFKEMLVKEGVITEAAFKKHETAFRCGLTLHFHEFFYFGYHEQGVLMEWPDALKFYETMGEEIAKARARGEFSKSGKEAS